MFCAERVQRLVMAGMLCLAYYLMSIQSIFGTILFGFIVAMIIVWAITDFCPSIAMLKKLIGSCYDKKVRNVVKL